MFVGLMASSIKVFREHQKTQFKIGSKSCLKPETVFIAFMKNKYISKLNFLQCLDTTGMKVLSPKIWINEVNLVT